MEEVKLTIANDHYALMHMNGGVWFAPNYPSDGDTYTLTHTGFPDDPDNGKTWSFVYVEDHWEFTT
tara:strand:- start:1249 stop:1446 length:198 start_codon:yes stop_codon:yes gene_type:complete